LVSGATILSIAACDFPASLAYSFKSATDVTSTKALPFTIASLSPAFLGTKNHSL